MHIIEPDRRFQPWDYESVAKADGGEAYVVVEPDGHVTVHKGLKPRSEAGVESGSPIVGEGSSEASVVVERRK